MGPCVASPPDTGGVAGGALEADSGTDGWVDSAAAVVAASVAVDSWVSLSDEDETVESVVAGSESELQADPARHSTAVTSATDAWWVRTTST